MTPDEAVRQLKIDTYRIISNEAHTLYTKLVQASPVDEGTFKLAWRAPMKNGENSWRIHNSVDYATILAGGRYYSLGRWYGSEQWAGGLTPMLFKTNNEIQRRLDDLKY